MGAIKTVEAYAKTAPAADKKDLEELVKAMRAFKSDLFRLKTRITAAIGQNQVPTLQKFWIDCLNADAAKSAAFKDSPAGKAFFDWQYKNIELMNLLIALHKGKLKELVEKLKHAERRLTPSRPGATVAKLRGK